MPVQKTEKNVRQRQSPRAVPYESCSSENSQENTCARVSFLIKLQAWEQVRLWNRCFPVIFAKFLRIPLVTASLSDSYIFL